MARKKMYGIKVKLMDKVYYFETMEKCCKYLNISMNTLFSYLKHKTVAPFNAEFERYVITPEEKLIRTALEM